MTPLNPTDVLTPPVRIAFPNLWTPVLRKGAKPDEEPKRSACLLIPPTDEGRKTLAMLAEAMKAAMVDRWGKLVQLDGNRNPVKDAGAKDYAGFEDGWKYCNASSGVPIAVVDQAMQPITVEEGTNRSDKLFGGCWVRAYLSVYSWDNIGGKGVSVSLNAVQLVRPDTPLGRQVNVHDVFQAIAMPDDTGAPATGPAGEVDPMEALFG